MTKKHLSKKNKKLLTKKKGGNKKSSHRLRLNDKGLEEANSNSGNNSAFGFDKKIMFGFPGQEIANAPPLEIANAPSKVKVYRKGTVKGTK